MPPDDHDSATCDVCIELAKQAADPARDADLLEFYFPLGLPLEFM